MTDVAHGFQAYYTTTNAEGDEHITAWVSQDVQDLETELDLDILVADLEYRRDFVTGDSGQLSAGIGYRHVDAELLGDDPFWMTFDPEHRELHTLRAFAVQTWDLLDDDLSLVLGAQAEHNNLTEFELQPTVRVSWHPQADYTLWASATRSVRTPSLEEVGLASGSYTVGNPDFKSENVRSYELGCRWQVDQRTGLDLAMFHNDYDDLQVEEFDPATFEYVFQNGGEGSSDGFELAIDSKPTETWNLRSAYSYIRGTHEAKVGGFDLGTDEYHPKHQFNIRSYHDLADDLELDLGLYLVEGMGDAFEDAERTRLDMRLGWNPRPGVEAFVGLQRIGSTSQTEFGAFDEPRAQVLFGVTLTANTAR